MNNHLEQYKLYGNRLRELQQAAIEWGMSHHHHEFLRTARKLHMLGEDNTLLFEADSEVSILMDGFIYEGRAPQGKIMTGFLAQYACRDEIDRHLSNAMRQARFGLYRIESVLHECADLQLKALVAEITDARLTNIALSETAIPGMIIGLRVLRLPEMFIASGVFFPFAPVKEKRVVREWWKQQGLERYAHIFRLSGKESIQAKFV